VRLADFPSINLKCLAKNPHNRATAANPAQGHSADTQKYSRAM